MTKYLFRNGVDRASWRRGDRRADRAFRQPSPRIRTEIKSEIGERSVRFDEPQSLRAREIARVC